MRPAQVFISYSHADERLRQALGDHLSALQRGGLIDAWHDRKIAAGQEWAGAIDTNLEQADIILLLVSASFLASAYCNDIELRRALERHERGEARVIPVILRPCDWTASPFAKLQALPGGGRAITTFSNRDAALLEVAKGIREVAQDLAQRPGRSQAGTQKVSAIPTVSRGAAVTAFSNRDVAFLEAAKDNHKVNENLTERRGQSQAEIHDLGAATALRRETVVFFYSHKDKKWLEQIKEMITPAIGSNLLQEWEDTQIRPGAKWREEIQADLQSAKVAVLLVSASFMNSEFIDSAELEALLKAAENEGVIICLVVLENCPYEYSTLRGYQAVNDVAKPLGSLTRAKQIEVLDMIARAILQYCLTATTTFSNRDAVVFFFSHKDKKWLEQIKEMITPVIGSNLLQEWNDTRIEPGVKWRDQIQAALQSAKVAVLLVSASFLQSEFIASEELPALLKAAENEGVIICPVVVENCLYDCSSLKDYQAVNDVAKPLVTLTRAKQFEALEKIARAILQGICNPRWRR